MPGFFEQKDKFRENGDTQVRLFTNAPLVYPPHIGRRSKLFFIRTHHLQQCLQYLGLVETANHGIPGVE